MFNDSLATHGLESGLESQWDSEVTEDQIFQPDENGMIGFQSGRGTGKNARLD